MARLATLDGMVRALKARREALGWSQLELEHRAGLSGGYVGKLESGIGRPCRRELGRQSLEKILRALGLEVVLVETGE